MQRACLALAYALALPALAACDGGGGCVIDSDCADFTQVCLEQRCVPRGTTIDASRIDAGATPDAGGERDAGRDSGPVPTEDAGDQDGGVEDDAGLAPCQDVTGAWSVSSILSPPCGTAAAGHPATISAGAGVCEYTVTSDDLAGAPAIDGTFTLSMEDNLAGTLTPGNDAAVECTGSLSGSTLTFLCGSCVMQLTR